MKDQGVKGERRKLTSTTWGRSTMTAYWMDLTRSRASSSFTLVWARSVSIASPLPPKHILELILLLIPKNELNLPQILGVGPNQVSRPSPLQGPADDWTTTNSYDDANGSTPSLASPPEETSTTSISRPAGGCSAFSMAAAPGR